MPGGKPLRIGPFIGGLNLGSDPTAIADAELVIARNFELDIDGSLVSRPPFQELDGYTGWSERIVLLCEAVFNGVHYLIGSNSDGVFYYLSGVWTLITSTFKAAAAVQYADKVYMVPHPSAANPGGKWDPVGGFIAVTAIPKGQACVIHKERLFVAPGSTSTVNPTRLVFSDAGNFDSWTGSNFVDVGQGDGTKLIDVTVYQDNLLLFKDQTTYVLAYDVRPTDAVVRKISQTIGVEGQFCVVNYENQVYVFHNGWVYEIVNYDFHRLNTKVPFVYDTTSPSAFAAEPFCVGILGDRLIIRYYNRTYVYGLRTRTWTEWISARSNLHYFGPIVATRDPSGDRFYAGSAITAFRTFIQLFDEQTALNKERTLSPNYTITDLFSRTVANGWTVADTGETWSNFGGANSDYAVAGGVGTITHTSKNVLREEELNTTQADFEFYVENSIPVVATGDLIIFDARVRYVDSNNHYLVRMNWGLTGGAAIQCVKVVAGVGTLLGSNPPSGGNYVANDKYSIRARFNGPSILIKCWKTSTVEPNGWTLTLTDATFTTGKFRLTSFIMPTNTNALNIVHSFDSLQIGPLSGQVFDIACTAKTKNFDMAVSNQFKKLWHWGADIISNRTVTGTANVIVLSFDVTWDQLEAAGITWDQIASFTWDQPLTEVPSIVTVNSTGTGTARRFARFKKTLRYRQINFQIDLVTDGSTGDGPARIFTLMVITETKQSVSKAIS